MHKLVMGSGLTLLALGAAVATAKVPPTQDGAVVVTETRCQPPAATQGAERVAVAEGAQGETSNAASPSWPTKWPGRAATANKTENNLPEAAAPAGATSRVASLESFTWKRGKEAPPPSAKTNMPVTTPCGSADFLKVK